MSEKSEKLYWKGPGVLNISKNKTIGIDEEIPSGALDAARIKKFRSIGKIVDHPSQVVVSGDEALKKAVMDLRRQLNSANKENTTFKNRLEDLPSVDEVIELKAQAEKVPVLEAEIQAIKDKAKEGGFLKKLGLTG